MPSITHDEQPIALHNIKCSSKTAFLKGSKSYRIVSTFVRSRHQVLTVTSCHQALTVRPCRQALTIINIYHYINTLHEA